MTWIELLIAVVIYICIGIVLDLVFNRNSTIIDCVFVLFWLGFIVYGIYMWLFLIIDTVCETIKKWVRK